MPLLGGIFGKKNKSSARKGHVASHGPASIAPSDLDSVLSSPTNSYVTTEKSLPSSPNGKNSLSPETTRAGSSQMYPSVAGNPSASSSRLRLPFTRKKQKSPEVDASSTFSTSPSPNSVRPPRPPYAARLSTSAASDTDATYAQRLRPPPSKSAIFAAYADPSGALSSRSLPDESMPLWPPIHSPLPPPKPPSKEKEKRPSLFSWTKSSSGTTKPPAPEQSKSPRLNLDSPPRLDSDSFNLKSFRHVRPPSPSASTSSLVVPPARPRGASINSDSSQRISVAAFREAQARRSTAGSPVPSFRSPSPSLPPLGFPQDGQRGRASPRPSLATNQPHSSPHLRNGAYHQKRRSTSLAVGYTSESEESTTASEEEESDDEGTSGGRNGHVHKDGTITPRTRPLIGRQAKSEIGHGSTSPTSLSPRPSPGFLATRSQSGHGQADENVRQNSHAANVRHSPPEAPPLRSNSSLDMYGGAARPRASASTSALSPSAAAKRASILVNANAGLDQDPLAEVKRATRHVRDSSTYSNPAPPRPESNHVDSDTSDSDSDSDNAPLASLVPPRRPGSSLSQASNASLRTNGTRGPAGRSMAKPLIDINELTDKKPSVGPYKGDDDGFTKGGLLASRLSPLEGPSVLVESPTSVGFPSSPLSGSSGSSGVASKIPPSVTSFVPPTSPPKEVRACASLDVRSTIVPSRPQPQPVQQSEKEEGSPERRRDGLTERLTKLAKGTGKDSIDASATLSLGGVTRSASPPSSQQQRIPNARSESPSKRAMPKLSIPQTGVSSKPSPPDDELIHDVDDSILRLISRMGDSDADMSLSPSPPPPTAKVMTTAQAEKDDDTTSESESDAYGEPERKRSVKEKIEVSRLEMPKMPSLEKETDRIAPIPIKQREPPSSFSVMSRPPINKHSEDDMRSTLTPMGPSTIANVKANMTFNASSTRSSADLDTPSITSSFKSNSTLNSFASSTASSSITTRKRSSTLIPSPTTPSVSATSSSSSSTFGPSTSSFAKLNASSRGGSSVASSSNASSTRASNPKLGSANADRAKALKTIASGGSGVGTKSTAAVDPAYTPRQRSSTMVPTMPSSASSQNKIGSRTPVASTIPVKPFAIRRDSPASSTGDSSSGRAPLTPRDGSDVGSSKTAPLSKKAKKDEWSSGVSGLSVTSTKGGMRSRGASNGPGGGRHAQRRSVSFDDDARDEGGKKSEMEDEDDAEARRKERRRSEAKAAIELGNVINGPGPIVSDDEDDLPIHQAMNARIPTMNPMMAMANPMSIQMSFNSAPGSPARWGGGLPSTAWPQSGPPQIPQMLAPTQFMVPTAGPNYMAAHQQAMMFAKQAYQIAVAQQAMAAAADEWDRNSVMGGGSVYGGPSSNVSAIMGPSPFNMMGGGMSNGWSTGSVIFPNSTQSVYGGIGGLSSSRSEYGGGGSVTSMAGGKWSSARSTYGDAFGPSDRSRPSGIGSGGNRNSTAMRDSSHYPPVPPIPRSGGGGSSSSGARGRGRTSSGPENPSRGGIRSAPPPSSWKAGV